MSAPHCRKAAFCNEKQADDYIEKLHRTSHREKRPVASYLCEKCLRWHITSVQNVETLEVDRLRRTVSSLKKEVEALRQKIAAQEGRGGQ